MRSSVLGAALLLAGCQNSGKHYTAASFDQPLWQKPAYTVTLVWCPNGNPPAATYSVYRATPGDLSRFVRIATGLKATSYLDTKGIPGSFYYVTATLHGTESAPSTAVSVVPWNRSIVRQST